MHEPRRVVPCCGVAEAELWIGREGVARGAAYRRDTGHFALRYRLKNPSRDSATDLLIYYPAREQLPRKLRVVVDFLRRVG